MINVNKNVLFCIGMLSFSNFLAAGDSTITVRFDDGGELAAEVTGKVNFAGNGSCDFTGVATGGVAISAGNVRVSSADPFGENDLAFEDDSTGRPRSLEATAAMTLPDITMNAAGTVTADDDVNLSLIAGDEDLTLDGPGQFTTTVNSRASSSNVNVNGVGGAKVASLTNKLPAGTVAVAAASRFEFGSALSVGEGDVAAPGKWSFESGATIKLRNGTDMHFDPKVHN